MMVNLTPTAADRLPQPLKDKSLFASFSSEKEDVFPAAGKTFRIQQQRP
jgi:hypothetical protein